MAIITTFDCSQRPTTHDLSDDGGAEVSTNGGKTWSDLDIPTAQFYHVALDNRFPHRIWHKQDNSSICIASRTVGNNIDKSDWHFSSRRRSRLHFATPHQRRYYLWANMMDT
ncbi:MAG: hypothetical protein IPN94_12855 [Sphingobacteriales bacterium]|nr:hypothetical protein [Sphingobacteriales bacterium]